MNKWNSVTKRTKIQSSSFRDKWLILKNSKGTKVCWSAEGSRHLVERRKWWPRRGTLALTIPEIHWWKLNPLWWDCTFGKSVLSLCCQTCTSASSKAAGKKLVLWPLDLCHVSHSSQPFVSVRIQEGLFTCLESQPKRSQDRTLFEACLENTASS